MGDSLAECSAVYIDRGTVLGVEGPATAGTVVVVAVEVLEAEGVRVIRYQFIICSVVTQIQTGDLRGRERGAVTAVLELVVADVGYVAGFLILTYIIFALICLLAATGLITIIVWLGTRKGKKHKSIYLIFYKLKYWKTGPLNT